MIKKRKTERWGRVYGHLSESLVVELKYDKTVNAAIQQIKNRHYTQALEGYAGKILAVGINYDRDNVNKTHSCVIERLKK